jgi:Tol biopolymer transport system component
MIHVLAPILLLALAACGGSKHNTDSGSAPPASSASAYVRQNSILLVNTTPGPQDPAAKNSIFTVRPDGSGKTLLAEGITPSWTPDGRIIYVADRQIWVMDEDGRNRRQVGNLSHEVNPLTPQLGTNGLVAFMAMAPSEHPEQNIGIYVMRLDGSGLAEVARGMQPSLALSGRWLTYTRQTENPNNRQIWRINTDGTDRRQLTARQGNTIYPDANASSISPDESWVAFFIGTEEASAYTQQVFSWGYRNVAIIPAEGGARRTLTPCKPVTTMEELQAATPETGRCIAADNPAWTPDGKWLVFDAGFFVPGESGTETWLVDMNGEHFQQFYPGPRGVVRVPIKYDRAALAVGGAGN